MVLLVSTWVSQLLKNETLPVVPPAGALPILEPFWLDIPKITYAAPHIGVM